MNGLRILLAGLMIVLLPSISIAGQVPEIRVAVLKFGTVMWELQTILDRGLDRKNGFRLAVLPVAGKQAAAIMLQAGDADAIVSDWLWAARQWPGGRRFVAIPYSRATGGVIVGADGVQNIGQLKGKRIGIAGGPLDKNWLMLQAAVRKSHGVDLARQADLAFAAPPIIHQKMLAGEFDAAINFWPYLARARARGLRFLTTTTQLADNVGLDTSAPLLAYIFSADFAGRHGPLVRAFANASQQAKQHLATSIRPWQYLRPRMKVTSDAEFNMLVDGFRAGIPAQPGWPAPGRLQGWIDFLRANGGSRLLGPVKTVPVDLFRLP